VEAPQGVFVSAYHRNQQTEYVYFPNATWTNQLWYDILNWEDGRPGKATLFSYEDWRLPNPDLSVIDWPATSWPQALTNGTDTTTTWDYLSSPTLVTTYTTGANAPILPQEHCDINTMPCGGPNLRQTADAELKSASGSGFSAHSAPR
jgi:hypothetical protein